MAQLIVRNIEDKVVRELKRLAGEHGISVEEEHRRILRDALLGRSKNRRSFKEFLLMMPDAGADRVFRRQKDFGRDVTKGKSKDEFNYRHGYHIKRRTLMRCAR